MRIKGSSVQRFFPIFLKYWSPSVTFSETSTTTMFNIMATYAALGSQPDRQKISVTDIVKKSGYSRTTFYSYFSDVEEIISMMEEMISYHTYINADVYLNSLMGNLGEEEEDEIIRTLDDFGPYIYALMEHSPGYQTRYTATFHKAFEKAISQTAVSDDIRITLVDATCAAMVYMISQKLYQKGPASFKIPLEAAKIIIQSITKNTNQD